MLCNRARALILIASTLGAFSACDGFTGTVACTEIGCGSGLQLTFDAAPPPGTVVEAQASGGVTRRVECGVQISCDNGIFFSDFTPDHVVIRVITPSGEAAHERLPVYEAWRPNGPDCPPTCHVARIEVDLP